MKKSDLVVLGLAGVAVLVILKTGGALPTLTRKPSTGLSYKPTSGYGDTSKYTDYASTALSNGGWGIE